MNPCDAIGSNVFGQSALKNQAGCPGAVRPNKIPFGRMRNPIAI
jgi:hypothetical protein